MKKIRSHCKFCGADVMLNLFDPGRQWFSEKWLLDMAACNRCADFLEQRRSVHEKIRRLTVEKASPERMEGVMRKWLEKMNNYFQTKIDWDPSVMDLLLDENTNVNTVLLQCERMLRQETPVAALRVGRAVFPIQ